MKVRYKNISEKDKSQVEKILAFLKSDAQEWSLSTSGSTGPPKSIALDKDQIEASARATLSAFSISDGAKALAALPVNKVGGFMMLARAYYGNWQLCLTSPSAQPLEAWPDDTFEFAAMVPYQVQQSLDHLQRVEKLIIGGAPLSAELEKSLSQRREKIYHTFGMTETLSHVAFRQISPQRETYYKAVPGVDFQEQQGALVIHAPHIDSQPLYTNDLVELIDKHRFKWLGRKDNVINSGGIKLIPEVLENKVKLDLPHLFFGQADNQWGQAVHWLIECRMPLEENTLEEALEALEPMERPKDIHFLSEFCYTKNGKIDRSATIEQWRSSP